MHSSYQTHIAHGSCFGGEKDSVRKAKRILLAEVSSGYTEAAFAFLKILVFDI